MTGCGGKVWLLFGTAVGRVGSSRGRIGNTMVGTGLDGSFVPCARAASKDTAPQNVTVKTSTAARIVLPLSNNIQRNLSAQVPGGLAAIVRSRTFDKAFDRQALSRRFLCPAEAHDLRKQMKPPCFHPLRTGSAAGANDRQSRN